MARQATADWSWSRSALAVIGFALFCAKRIPAEIGSIQNFTGGLAQLLAPKGIRVNAVAPGPIWTPLIPSTMPEDSVVNFGKQVPMKRAGQPAELATAYVMLADPQSSYTSGTTVAVTGGKPFI